LSFRFAWTRGVNSGEWDRPSAEDAALEHFASGSEIEPRLIDQVVVAVRAGAEAELFRYATLDWSVPVSAGYGRRNRFLVFDRQKQLADRGLLARRPCDQPGRLIGRFGTRRLIAAGLTAFAIGYALFLREHSPHLTHTTMLLPSMIVIGLGWGLGFPAFNIQATAAVTDAEQALAAGLFITAFQIGGAIFIAVVSAVISSHTPASGGGEASGILAAMRPALAILIPAAAAGTIVLFAVRQPRPKIQSTEAPLPDFQAN
jgi:hypothetical protein